jgi:hypothetical protein
MRSREECRHIRQRVVTLRDFTRRQICSDCNTIVFRLPPANPSNSELLAESERRKRLLGTGRPSNRRNGNEAA